MSRACERRRPPRPCLDLLRVPRGLEKGWGAGGEQGELLDAVRGRRGARDPPLGPGGAAAPLPLLLLLLLAVFCPSPSSSSSC